MTDRLAFTYIGRVDTIYNSGDFEGQVVDCVDCNKRIKEGEAIIGDRYKYEPESKTAEYLETFTDWSHSRCYVPWEEPYITGELKEGMYGILPKKGEDED